MSEVTLGKPPRSLSARDSVHVAVAAAKAREELHAGDKVGFVDYHDRVASRDSPNIIGIVDPFRADPVPPNGEFWLCLFPGSVTGMRHQWVHPEFPATEVDDDDSEAWLRRYAAVNNPDRSPNHAFKELVEGLRDGNVTFRGKDVHSLHDVPDADDLQRHAENFLGCEIDFESTDFGCAC